jgi:hypothetical protein
MEDFSKRALLSFIDASIAKGHINANTGAGVRAACNKILEQFGPEEDVRTVDAKAAVIQYNNRHPSELSSNSLRQYESRVRAVIESFIQSVNDPTAYKLPARQNGVKVDKGERRKKQPIIATAVPQARIEPEHQAPARAVVTDTSLAIPFPLRPTFLAQIVIPRDLTKDEAKRLGLFIDALAQNPQG